MDIQEFPSSDPIVILQSEAEIILVSDAACLLSFDTPQLPRRRAIRIEAIRERNAFLKNLDVLSETVISALHTERDAGETVSCKLTRKQTALARQSLEHAVSHPRLTDQATAMLSEFPVDLATRNNTQ
jgi:hypothetical protein